MEKKKEAIIQNLKDAGCDNDTITCFMNYFEAKEIKKELQVLSKHRRTLLDALHICQNVKNRLTAWIIYPGK